MNETHLDPIDVRTLRELLGLTRELFARVTGYALHDVEAWEDRNQALEMPALQRMKEFSRLQYALAAIMSPELVPTWLQTASEQFQYSKPIEVKNLQSPFDA
ncbi:MAG: hypothetical protein H0T51_13570 [Pirellulales bacterium]|nr:hypothetical protein [Pirellulales bacterium]